jgi:Mn2+/Fe2+ NRAMP family transporter
MLSVMGTSAGVLIAKWCLEVARNTKSISLPQISEAKIDGGVILFTIGLAILTTVVFGSFPALQAGKTAVIASLQEGSAASGAARGSTRVRSVFVVVEIALSLVVLIGAGLVAKSFHRLMSVDPGFRAEHLLMLNQSLLR